MRHGGILAALAAVIAAFAMVLGGCGTDAPTGGTDADDNTPAEARDVILTALETMYTWSPAKDESTLDAYQRALPYLGQELQAGKDNRVERGNSVWWQQWKRQQAEVTAEVMLIPTGHPEDTDTRVERSVMVTLTVTKPDGTEIEKNTLRIERVVAEKGDDGWRVEEISFFPQNSLRTTTTTSSRPTTTVPGRLCPDGSTVPAGQVCSTRTTTTRVIPTTTTRPIITTTTTQPIITTTTTPPTPPPCPDPDQIRDTEGQCVYECPDGTTAPVCASPEPCPYPGQTPVDDVCVCPSGQEVVDGVCDTPVEPCDLNPQECYGPDPGTGDECDGYECSYPSGFAAPRQRTGQAVSSSASSS